MQEIERKLDVIFISLMAIFLFIMFFLLFSHAETKREIKKIEHTLEIQTTKQPISIIKYQFE